MGADADDKTPIPDDARPRHRAHGRLTAMRAERFHRLRAVLVRRQPDLTVLMDRVNKSHNFSAILRNCDAVGVLEANVVPPEKGLDVHHGTSAGSKKWVAVRRHPDISTAITYLKERDFVVMAAHVSDESTDYREIDYTLPTAIVLGAELHGVSDESLGLADLNVSIPLAGMVHSLNVSVASALILFEARRQREAAGMYDHSRLSETDFDRRLFEWTYPRLASACRGSERPYPTLSADGEIIRES